MLKIIPRCRRPLLGVLLFLIIGVSLVGRAQENSPAAKQNTREAAANSSDSVDKAATNASTAVAYTYEFTQPEFFVRHIVIEHDAAGRGKITFERKNESAAVTEPVELSRAALERIAAQWSALNFLESDASYQASKQFPHLGTMRLKMQRGTQERAAEFNWTSNRNVSSLVDEYRRVGEQALFIFDIKLAREMQPLEAPKIMNRLDMLLSRNGLSDPQQILPLLEDLSIDERIPLIARNQATRLIKKIKK